MWLYDHGFDKSFLLYTKINEYHLFRVDKARYYIKSKQSKVYKCLPCMDKHYQNYHRIIKFQRTIFFNIIENHRSYYLIYYCSFFEIYSGKLCMYLYVVRNNPPKLKFQGIIQHKLFSPSAINLPFLGLIKLQR